ncbi:MAG: ELWxxDGT repeat protein, partial [Thermoanaerobaculia bacterium]
MKRFAVCALFALLALPAVALESYLVKDIDPAPGPADSDPRSPVTLGDAVLFFTGSELWRSDGTSAGTFALTSGAALPDPRPFLVTEDLYFFLSNHPLLGPAALWVSDGTPAGTFPLTEPGVRVFGEHRVWRAWVASQGVLYFVAWDAEHGAELWRSDGTPAGTHLVADVRPGSEGSNVQELTEYRGRVWFSADDGEHGGALWRSDGTAASTVLAVDPVPSSAFHAGPQFVQVVNGRLTFFALPPGRGRSRQLWAGDGTARGTAPVTNLTGGKNKPAAVHDAVVYGNRLYFLVEDRKGEELWASDGTGRGTQALTSFPNADAFPYTEIRGMGVNGRFVFVADDGSHGPEPWVTDGTPRGTRLLRDVCPGLCSSSTALRIVFAGRLYFTAMESSVGSSLWSTDGTPQGTRFVSDTPGGASSFFVVGSRLLFLGADEHGLEIWRTDGTQAGTVRVTDFAPRSFFDEEEGFQGAVLDGQLLFGADDGEHGLELWRTDGTLPNTGLVEDINQVDLGGSNPRSLRPLGDEVVFVVGGEESELWKSDGTAAGTVQVRTFAPDERDGANPQGAYAEAGGLLFYFSYEIGDRYVPWRTDGTAAGTFRLTDEGAPGCCDRQEMEAVGGTVFFDLRDEEHGRELWASDGTAA